MAFMITRTVSFALLCIPGIVAADVPPPPGYVETCTVEKQCKADEEGRTCSANYNDTAACEKTLGKDGFVRRCKSYGASVWTEVWCRARKKK
jgi:hypothetical protein